ncbi:hypothetical protein SARC_09017, partial [Sphaeroforma arctica JP610]
IGTVVQESGYRSSIGFLMFAIVVTRADIIFATSICLDQPTNAREATARNLCGKLEALIAGYSTSLITI